MVPAGRRILPQSLSTDPRFARLSLKAKVLYPLLWVNADDQGRLSGNPDKVKLAVCASVPEIASEDIPSLIDEMVRAKSPGDLYGLVIHYNTSKAAAIQITDWWGPGGQRPQWAWPSDYEPPEGWKDHLRYKRGPKEVVRVNWPPLSPENSGEVSPGDSPERGAPAPSNLTPSHSPEEVGGPPVGAGSGEGSGEASGDIRLSINANANSIAKQTQTRDELRSSPAPPSRGRQKPHQVEAALFLDMVEDQEKIPLLNRTKLINLVRPLFKIQATTPEKLLDCYCWLKENVLFLANKAPPQVIGAMPDRYPAWVAGKLRPERRPYGKPGAGAEKTAQRRAPVRGEKDFRSRDW